MTTAHSRIDTSIASVERDSEGLIEVRIRSGVTLTVAGIAEVLQARQRLADGRPRLALIAFPSEEVDFELSMITSDHYSTLPVDQFTRAVAWVTGNARNDQFCRLYFAYFPSPVPSAIFEDEASARSWLHQFLPGSPTG